MTPEQENDNQNKQAKANCCTSEPRVLKDFQSCGIEEKVERLHAVIKDVRRSLEYLHQTNMALSTKLYALEHHQHSEKGDCMIRIEDTNRNGGIGGSISPSAMHDLLA